MRRYSSYRVACLCTQCSFDFWASSHLDTQPAKHLLRHSVSDCCLGSGPVQISPLPTGAFVTHLYLPCLWCQLDFLDSCACCTVLLGEWRHATLPQGKFLLTCIHLLKVRKKCSKTIPCPSTSWLVTGLYQLTVTLMSLSIPLSALSYLGSVCCFNLMCLPTLCFWSVLVSWADHWKFDAGILLHFCSLVLFSAWMINQCKCQEAGFSFTASYLVCNSNTMAPFQPTLSDDDNTVGQGCKDIALPALVHLYLVTEWELTLVPSVLIGAGP